MEEIKLLQAPDTSRYVFYSKKPQRVANVNAKFQYKVPAGITQEQKKLMVELLMHEHFLYLDEQMRKFWDDINGIKL